MTGRFFLKHLPLPKREYLHRLYTKYKNLAKFTKQGPVLKLHSLIRRVQFKKTKKCESKCSSKCYKLIGDEKIELTEEEKKKYADLFPCKSNSQQFQFIDLNGKYVDSQDQASYGCGCNCGGGKGGIQINENPFFNFDIDIMNDKQLKELQQFLGTTKFAKRIPNTKDIDMDKLKKKYGTSKLGGMYNFSLKQNLKNRLPVYLNQKFNSQTYNGGQNQPHRDYNNPSNLGTPEYDDFNKKIRPGEPYVLNGRRVNPNDGNSRLPFLFKMNQEGNLETFGDNKQEGRKKQYVLKAKDKYTGSISNEHNYPLYYSTNESLNAENLNSEQSKEMKGLQELLSKRYPIYKSNYPVPTHQSPATIMQNNNYQEFSYVQDKKGLI